MNLVNHAGLYRLQAELLKMPQYEPNTEHFFHGGIYARRVWRPAGCLIVGKVHKAEHFYVCVSGRVQVNDGAGVKEIGAGELIMSPVGTKRAVLALEDSVCMTFHVWESDERDIDKIEADLAEEDLTGKYISGNKLGALS